MFGRCMDTRKRLTSHDSEVNLMVVMLIFDAVGIGIDAYVWLISVLMLMFGRYRY